jgi:hypothetical protein
LIGAAETRLLWLFAGAAFALGLAYYFAPQVLKPFQASTQYGWFPLPGDPRFQAYGRMVDGELMYSAWKPVDPGKK